MYASGWLVGNLEVIPLNFACATPECTHGINTGMRHSHSMLVWYIGAMIRHNEKCARTGSVPSLTLNPCTPRPSAEPYAPPSLKRAIAARWKVWAPWVGMQQLRARDYAPSVAAAETVRLRHSEHILDLMRDGISMRTIRRHRLDDPRLTDEVRAVLVEAARERQSKAWAVTGITWRDLGGISHCGQTSLRANYSM